MLPLFSPAAFQLLALSTESDDAISRFEVVFRSDPALAAELLRAANSAEFGRRWQITGIRHALMTLGLERTRTLAFTIAMQFYVRNLPRRMDAETIWRHSLAAGVIAERLAERNGLPLDAAYTAALLHDIGRLGLLASLGKSYGEMLSLEFENSHAAMEYEIAKAGVAHTEAGAFLAHVWGFPEQLRCSISLHHDAPEDEGECLVSIVQLACRAADSLGFPEVVHRPERPLAGILPPAVRDRFSEQDLRGQIESHIEVVGR